jgi:hypothetical protein
MGWLDPVECCAASECLAAGNAREAARLLLNSPTRDHRAARRLLLEINVRLVDEANNAHCKGEIQAAWETIECAAQCAALGGEGAVLRERIARDLTELQKNDAWQQARLKRARAWADQGRLHSALGLIAPLKGAPDAGRLQIDLEERLGRFERYLCECRELLKQGDDIAAGNWLQKARAIIPADPDVIRLASELREANFVQYADAQPNPPAQPLNRGSMGFALTDLALFVLTPEIVIGNPRGDGVHIPLLANVHRRHAYLRRSKGQYRLEPVSERCLANVNGRRILAARTLRDGDRLEFGSPSCAWIFRVPVPGSSTAVLEMADPGGVSIWAPDGSSFRTAILVDDTVRIVPGGVGHLLIPHLPCASLTMLWREDKLMAEAMEGILSVEALGQEWTDAAVPLHVPSKLTIQSEMSERERLGRAFAGLECPDILTLAVSDPYRAKPAGSPLR